MVSPDVRAVLPDGDHEIWEWCRTQVRQATESVRPAWLRRLIREHTCAGAGAEA